MLQFPPHDRWLSLSLKSKKSKRVNLKVSAIRPCIESFSVCNQKAFLMQTFPFESVHGIVPASFSFLSWIRGLSSGKTLNHFMHYLMYFHSIDMHRKLLTFVSIYCLSDAMTYKRHWGLSCWRRPSSHIGPLVYSWMKLSELGPVDSHPLLQPSWAAWRREIHTFSILSFNTILTPV